MKLFIREPITVIITLTLPVIFLFVMGCIFGNEASTDDSSMVFFRGAGTLPEVLTGAMDIVGQITLLYNVIIILQEPYLGFGWNQNASLIVAGIAFVATALAPCYNYGL